MLNHVFRFMSHVDIRRQSTRQEPIFTISAWAKAIAIAFQIKIVVILLNINEESKIRMGARIIAADKDPSQMDHML